MNCQCNPPKLAVMKVSQSAKSAGKEYFSCPNGFGQAGCGFFVWVGANMPMSLAFGRNKFQNKGKKAADIIQNAAPQKVNGKFEAKLMVYEILEGPPVEIWLSIQCPSTPVVNDLFARLPPGKCRFNNGLKMWLFNFDQYERVMTEFLTPPFESIHLPDISKFLAKGLAFYQKKVNKLNFGLDPPLNLNERVLKKILPFQLEAVKFVVRRGGRALLGDEMGCGKTLQAISIMMHYRAHWPVLVVVPSSLLTQWPNEIMSYAGDVVQRSDIRCVGSSSQLSTGLITLITYKVMDNLVANKLLSPDQFGVVIADESHNLKNKDSQRSQAVIPFLKKATIAVCMTGTPAVNRPVELYSQLHGILPEVFSDYHQFATRYCDAKPHKSLPGLNVSGSSNENELNLLLTSLVMIRRTKDAVLKTLPEKKREIRYVEPDPEFMPEIRKCNARSRKIDEAMKSGNIEQSELQKMNNEKQQILTALYSITGSSKIVAIKNEVVKLIEELKVVNKSESDHDEVQTLHTVERGDPLYDATQVMQELQYTQHYEYNYDMCDVDGSGGSNSNTHNTHSKRKGTSATTNTTNNTSKAGTTSTSHKPILLELEDDFMTETDPITSTTNTTKHKANTNNSSTIDLCDSDTSHAHKRAKTTTTTTTSASVPHQYAPPMGTADSDDDYLTADEGNKGLTGKGLGMKNTENDYWNDNGSDCDFNISRIKRGGSVGKSSGVNNAASHTNTDTNTNTNTDTKVYSLFDQHSKHNKPKPKAKTNNTTTSTTNKKKGSAKGRKKNNKAKGGDSNSGSGSESDVSVFVDDNQDESDDELAHSTPSNPLPLSQKIIVFFHHKNVLSAIEDALLKLRVCFIKIDGATSQKNRGKLIERFQNDDVTDVALLSLTACGVGLNLTRASIALFGELNWSLGVVLQAEDRIHRLGQRANEVRIVYMIARNTLDETVWDQLQSKHQVVGATVGTSGKSSYGGGMSITSNGINNTSGTSNGNNTVSGTSSIGHSADLRSYYAQPMVVAPQQAAVQSANAVGVAQANASAYNNTSTGASFSSGYGGTNSVSAGYGGGYGVTTNITNTTNTTNTYTANTNTANTNTTNSTNTTNATYIANNSMSAPSFRAPIPFNNSTNTSSNTTTNNSHCANNSTTNTTCSTNTANNYNSASNSATNAHPSTINTTTSASATNSGYNAPYRTSSYPPTNAKTATKTTNSNTVGAVGNNMYGAGIGTNTNHNAYSSSNTAGFQLPPTLQPPPHYNNAPINPYHVTTSTTLPTHTTTTAPTNTIQPTTNLTTTPPTSTTLPTTSTITNTVIQEEFAYSASTQASEATSSESRPSLSDPKSAPYAPVIASNPVSVVTEPGGYGGYGGYGVNNGMVSSAGVSSNAVSSVVNGGNLGMGTSTAAPGMVSAAHNTTSAATNSTNTNTNINSTYPPHAPSTVSNAAATTTSTTFTSTTTSTSKAPLPPEVLARIEANKQAAQARLAARQQQVQQSGAAGGSFGGAGSGVGGVSSAGASGVGASVNNSNTTTSTAGANSASASAVPPTRPGLAPPSPLHTTSASATTSKTFGMGSPVALQAAIQSRQATANLPPGAIASSAGCGGTGGGISGSRAFSVPLAGSHANNTANTVYNTQPSHLAPLAPPPTPAHVFSTARGSSIAVSDAHMQQAAALLNPITTSTGGSGINSSTGSGSAAHVFSTARGSSVAVSDAHMQQAAALLNPITANPSGGSSVNSSMGSGSAAVGQVLGYGGVQTSSTTANPTHVNPTNTHSITTNTTTSTTNPTYTTNPNTTTTTTITPQQHASATLYFDGAASVHPCRGGAGYMLFTPSGASIAEHCVRMSGTCSSNQAEYVGLIHGLTCALHRGVQDLTVFGDSEVVIKQMLGMYPVKNPALQGMHTRAQSLRQRFRSIRIQWVPREKNTGADALAQRALLQPESAGESADWFKGST